MSVTPPPHVAEILERLKAMYPGARIESEVRWFVRAYQPSNSGGHEICVDVRNLAHGE
jgi:hypothetical protein